MLKTWFPLPAPWTVRRPPVPAVLAQAGQAGAGRTGWMTVGPGYKDSTSKVLRIVRVVRKLYARNVKKTAEVFETSTAWVGYIMPAVGNDFVALFHLEKKRNFQP